LKEGAIITTIDIFKDTPLEVILGEVDNALARHRTKYIVTEFQDDLKVHERKKTVDTIKKYYDIFIVLKSAIPQHKYRIEEYFSYGVHGLYFSTSADAYSREQVEVLTFATELFTRGWVFANAQNDKNVISQLISLKVIPVPSEQDSGLVKFIKSHQSFANISPNLRSVPLLEQEQSDYSLADKIKMKMLLETMNLRQKLMVKNIDESFGSSGL